MTTPQTPYQILGDQGIADLCQAFYAAMDKLPEAAGIRAMHGEDLSPVTGKLTDYLVEWMGGPPRYSDVTGSVCMTDPHAGYHIGPAERDQWLLCMQEALSRIDASDELRQMLETPLFRIADAVRNREGASAAEGNPNIIAAN